MAEIKFIGEAASLGAATVWACSMTLYTRFGRNLTPRVLNLFKCCVAICFLAILGCIQGWHWPSTTSAYTGIIISGAIGLAIGDSFLFFSLQTLGVQKTSVIQCLAPPLAALISWAFFDETLGSHEWLGLLITTSALAILMWGNARETRSPDEHKVWGLGILCALAAALCQAIGMIALRHSLQGGDIHSGTFIRVSAAIVFLLIFTAIRGEFSRIPELFQPPRRGAILAFAAFIGTFLGQLLMSTGAKFAKAGVATALSSTSPLWLVPIAHFILKEKVTPRAVFCTLAAVFGVILMMF